jgi:hypothetical protein
VVRPSPSARAGQRGLNPFLFKGLLFALLAANTAYYTLTGATSKAIDATAWLTLLALFLAETRLRSRPGSASLDLVVRAARLAAAAGVVVAMLRYLIEGNALDSTNSVLWIGVVMLLEAEFRYPQLVARSRTAFAAVAVALYGGLAVLVIIWALSGAWLDAYDALLWLIAFVTLELDAVSAQPASATLSPPCKPAGKG